MHYAKLTVKTEKGIITHYYKFAEPWQFGKFLCQYYKGKEYEWDEISENAYKLLSGPYHKTFKEIA